MTTKSHRWRWSAITATAVLLAGCGSGEESGGDGGRAAALTKEQARRVLPDGASMDGWMPAAEPNRCGS